MKRGIVVASLSTVAVAGVAFGLFAVVGNDASVSASPTTTEPLFPPPSPAPPPPPPLAQPTAQPPPPPDQLLGDIDQVVKQLPVASIAFNAPTTLGLNESTEMQLLLSLKEPVSELKGQLTEVGKKEGARVQVSDQVEARLTGLGFRIEAITPETQIVRQSATALWRWDVEATETGSQQLHLSVSALVAVDGVRTPAAIRTFDRDIDVNVTLGQRIVDVATEYSKAWAAALVPLAGLVGGLLWRRWKRRRRRDEEQYGWSNEP
jgi:hypothetical protein